MSAGAERKCGEPVTIAVAARELGVGVTTVRGWLRAGAPQAVRGRRGRGRNALLDVRAIKAWRTSCADAGGSTAALEVLAAEIPEILAEAAWRAFQVVQDDALLTAHARRMVVGALLLAWTKAATDIRGRIAREAPNVAPELIGEVEKIAVLARHLNPNR